MITRFAALALVAGLAACNAYKPDAPAIAPTSAGSSTPLAQRLADDVAGRNSPNASAGQASITGTVGSSAPGRPNVVYSGQAPAGSGVGSGMVANPSATQATSSAPGATVNPNVRQGSR
jgi:hypothetical protein